MKIDIEQLKVSDFKNCVLVVFRNCNDITLDAFMQYTSILCEQNPELKGIPIIRLGENQTIETLTEKQLNEIGYYKK